MKRTATIPRADIAAEAAEMLQQIDNTIATLRAHRERVQRYMDNLQRLDKDLEALDVLKGLLR